MSLSNTVETATLTWLMGTYATWYVAYGTASAGEDGSSAAEPSGGTGYAREAYGAYTVSGEEKSFYEFSRETLEKYVVLHERTYLLDHMHALAMRMSEELQKRPMAHVRPPVQARMGVGWQRRQFTQG